MRFRNHRNKQWCGSMKHCWPHMWENDAGELKFCPGYRATTRVVMKIIGAGGSKGMSR